MYETATFFRRNRDITLALLTGDRATQPTSTNTEQITRITPMMPQADIPLLAGGGGGVALFSAVVASCLSLGATEVLLLLLGARVV